ncbi:MAG: prepilin-type N-terminal cleavage/methylation domain-containing protein [Gemmatimonadaceae bacterium]|nr:prepilin-type N-terminal cleavage/methylation domain-containing protein [Gemmatimonadaceae bacterium]
MRGRSGSGAAPPRAGFTLVELMIALTLTAIAATIAGTAVSAARRTEQVVLTHRHGEEADLRARALLQDMLRHAPAAALADAPLLAVRGTPDDPTLVFLSRGVTAPFGTGVIWQVTVQRLGDSLRVDAVPTRDTGAPSLRMAVGGITSFQVRALEPATALDAARWRSDWPLATARPAAVALTWERRGAAATPLIVALDPLQAGAP